MAKQKERKQIYVYADWEWVDGPRLMGILCVDFVRGEEIFSFAYDEDWLASGYAQELDPDLQFYAGEQYPKEDKPNFGMFTDSAPDRWGRILLQRREAILARKENRDPAKLYESDYLLGVCDYHRVGGLRFSLRDGSSEDPCRKPPEPQLHGTETPTAVPLENLNSGGESKLWPPRATGESKHQRKTQALASPWAKLRELAHASLRVEEDDKRYSEEYAKWLDLLIDPGSSLGGARPKASVCDEEGNLWVAKFPSKDDDTNVGAWEMLAHRIALDAGVRMAESRVQKFSSAYDTFLTKRFDREKGKRIHFTSAMTCLGKGGGNESALGASYLELAEFLIRHGADTNADLEELWRRIVLSICISNTDDHLRNHGFLLTSKGWRLSPAYDINPYRFGNGLRLNISEHDNSQSLELALSVSGYFRVDEAKAGEIIERVREATLKWRQHAEELGLSRQQQDDMARAFRMAEGL